ncbi:MAG: hypothetical protein LBC31_04195 [Treponema sp.]|nr:hypothetical protein [Treponema sp.]
MGDMAQTQPQRGLTFEDVWAAMMETGKQIKETDRQLQELSRRFEETDRFIKEMTARSDREMEKTRQSIEKMMDKTDRQIAKTDKQIGELGNRFGELAEHLVTPNIAEKFRALNYTFTRAGPNVEFFSRDRKFLAEVDVWLENGDFAMAVEVKSRLRKEHVEEHIKRMGILRAYFDERQDPRKLLGAMAGAIVPVELRNYVLKKGFYVIEQSGDTVKIEAPEGFKPRMW